MDILVESLRLKLKEQKGFTLIELLAVIVILGIIAAIAIPAIGNVITKSDNKAKVQDALQIIDAAKLYVADNNPTTDIYLSLNGTGAKDGTVAAPAELNSYLDRVKDSGFVVKVSYTAGTSTTGAKYSYSISNHDAVSVVNGTTTKTAYVTEKSLVSFVQ
jgi:type IV pilus assembly protein PilA